MSSSEKNSNKCSSNHGFQTRAIHAGQSPAPGNNAIMTPIYQTSTFAQISPGIDNGYDYARSGNPTRTALQKNLASLEGGKHAYCFSSGCAAASCAIQLFSSGDHVICCDDVYGGTFRLFDKVYKRFGLEYTNVDLTKLDKLEGQIKPNTKLIWIETPTNPLLKIIDIEEVCKIAKKHNVIVVVDNTFASPYLQNPLALGADIVLHSSTKYIGGHSDVISGALITNDDSLAETIQFLQNAIGSIPAPMDCFLQIRSTKTLGLRMEKHSENALKLAEYLSNHPDIESVTYPGLDSHPQREVAKKQMSLGGGMIAAVIKGNLKRANAFLESVKVFTLAESLGGVESLIEHPAIMTHATIPVEQRKALGIDDGLIRISVGIEDYQDLEDDIKQALAVSKQS